jgi:hypothetical protein
MSKMVFKKIFIKDINGFYYHILSVANPKDSWGEFYLKVAFPGAKGLQITSADSNEEGMIGNFDVTSGITEFTYHYRSGISHFKNKNDYVDPKRNIPTLNKDFALQLFRYTIFLLDVYKPENNPIIINKDFVLPINFDKKARGLELAISRVKGPWKVTNTQGDEPVSTYILELEDPNVFFVLSDSVWNRGPMINMENPSFEIFRYNNPIENISFTPKESS